MKEHQGGNQSQDNLRCHFWYDFHSAKRFSPNPESGFQTSSPSPNKIATLHCFIYVKVVGRNNEVYVKVVWTSIQKVWDEDIAGWWGHANADGVGQGAKRVHFGATPLLHHPLAPLGPLMQKMQNLGLATLQLSLSFGSSSSWWDQDKWQGMGRPGPIATAIVSIFSPKWSLSTATS